MAITLRIPNLTDCRLIRAFFGDEAKVYDYEVTLDDFDAIDNEAPGHYCGVEVWPEAGERWDAGIRACREAGVHGRSREGLMLRWRLVDPEATELPADLEAVARDRDAALAREAARQAEEQAQRERETAGERMVEGMYELPFASAHTEVMQLPEIRALMAEAGVTDASRPDTSGMEQVADTGTRYRHRNTYYRMADGSVLKSYGSGGVSLYTTRADHARTYYDAVIRVCGTGDDFWGRRGQEARAALAALDA